MNQLQDQQDFDSDQKLWDILGQAPQAPVRPMFAADVVRRTRKDDRPAGPARWLRFVIPVVAPASIALMVALTGLLSETPAPSSGLSGDWTTFAEAAGFTDLVGVGYQVVGTY